MAMSGGISEHMLTSWSSLQGKSLVTLQAMAVTEFHESGGDSAQHERDVHRHYHLGSENDSHGQLQRARQEVQ